MYHSLVQILAAARLIGKESGTTLAELQEHLGIARRSVFRTLEALDELGYPYYRDEEHDGRYKLVHPTFPPAKWLPLPPVEFSTEDRIVLDWSFETAAKNPALAVPIRNLRRKLDLIGALSGYALAPKKTGAGEGTGRPSLMRASQPGKATHLRDEAWLEMLFSAIEFKKVCSITYESRSTGSVETFPIHPLAAFESEDGLYAYAEIPSSGRIRIIALERLHDFVETGDSFEPPLGFDVRERLSDPFGIVQDEEIYVALLFSADQAPYVRERAWPESYHFVDHADGEVEMRFTTRGIYGLKRWILSWAEAVEVLEPASLRKDIAITIAMINEIYARK